MEFLPPDEARYDYVIDDVELEEAKTFFTSTEFLETVEMVSNKK